MNRALAVLAGMFAIFVLTAESCSAEPTATKSSSTVAATSSPSAKAAATTSAKPTATATPKPTPAPVAPACTAPCANYKGYTLTINGANRNVPPGEFSKPEAGAHFVQVTVTFHNGSKDNQRPDTFCCKLTDSTGITRSTSFNAVGLDGCESWQGVELAPGATLGPRNLCYEASGDPNAPLTLVWSPSFSSPEQKIKF